MIKTIIKGASISLLCSALYVNAETKSTANDLYVRAGAGIQFGNAKFKEVTPFDRRAPRTFPVFQIGVGYKLYDSIRTDLIFQYAEVRYRAPANPTLPPSMTTQRTRTYSAFINAYYDLLLHDNIAPYLTAGAGIGHNRTGSVGILTIFQKVRLGGTSKNHFIWNIGGGIQFKANKAFAVDLGYRFMDLGKAQNRAYQRPYHRANVKQPIRGHQIVGSLIYNF